MGQVWDWYSMTIIAIVGGENVRVDEDIDRKWAVAIQILEGEDGLFIVHWWAFSPSHDYRRLRWKASCIKRRLPAYAINCLIMKHQLQNGRVVGW